MKAYLPQVEAEDFYPPPPPGWELGCELGDALCLGVGFGGLVQSCVCMACPVSFLGLCSCMEVADGAGGVGTVPRPGCRMRPVATALPLPRVSGRGVHRRLLLQAHRDREVSTCATRSGSLPRPTCPFSKEARRLGFSFPPRCLVGHQTRATDHGHPRKSWPHRSPGGGWTMEFLSKVRPTFLQPGVRRKRPPGHLQRSEGSPPCCIPPASRCASGAPHSGCPLDRRACLNGP